jgi:hypothetical protein
MRHLLHAIRLNNEGANLLQSGQYQNAALSLRRAARMTIQCALKSRLPSLIYALPSDEDDALMLQDQHSESTVEYPRQHDFHLSSDGDLFLYQRPFVLSTEMHIESLSDYACAAWMVQHGILFNLAMASHSIGLAMSADAIAAEGPLELALEIYHCIMAHVDWDHGQSIMHVSMNNALWQCLVLNNLAHLHHDLCDYDYSAYCLACIGELTASTDCLNVLDDIRGDDARDIKLNLILPLFSKGAAAA